MKIIKRHYTDNQRDRAQTENNAFDYFAVFNGNVVRVSHNYGSQGNFHSRYIIR